MRHHGPVNTAQVEALRALLAPSDWLERAGCFARALHGRARTPRGLLIVGTPADEPWHLAAHLADESRLSGLPELEPTLVRWAPPPQAPPHLRVGLDRIERTGRSETLLVVGTDPVPAALLERIADARKAGTSILAIDQADPELDGLAHDCLAIRPVDPVSFDGAQHLVSMAIGDVAAARSAGRPGDYAGPAGLDGLGEPGGGTDLGGLDGRGNRVRSGGPLGTGRAWRGRLARLLDVVSGPQQS